MNDETAIPVFPCASPDETLEFYRALGFEVTHEQKKPYVYLAVKRGGFDLHFYGGGKPDPEGAAAVPGDGLGCGAAPPGLRCRPKEKLGRVPTAGQPRITRLRKGQRRFTVVDPGGNSIIFIAGRAGIRVSRQGEVGDAVADGAGSKRRPTSATCGGWTSRRPRCSTWRWRGTRRPPRWSVPASWRPASSWRWLWATRSVSGPRGPIWIRFPCPTWNASGSATSCRRRTRSSGCRDEWSVPVCRKPSLLGSRGHLCGHLLALRPLAWQRRPVSQESKKRSPGSFSVHISTKKVRPFHGRYPAKVTNVLVVHSDRPQTQ